MSMSRVKSCEPSGLRDLALLAEPGRRPLPFLRGVHPYQGTSPASGRNAWQRISLVSTVSGTVAFATSCHRLQPRGSIKMTCSETPSAQAWYARGVVSIDGARGGLDGDRSGAGCASEADHVQDARPGDRRGEARSDCAGGARRRARVAGAVRWL